MPAKGHHQTEEARAKISASKMGHPTSNETRRKIALGNSIPKPWLRHPLSVEHRQSISKGKKGKSYPQLSRRGKPSWSKGLTKETNLSVAKIAQTKLGKRRPDITNKNTQKLEQKYGVTKEMLEKLYLDEHLIIREIHDILSIPQGKNLAKGVIGNLMRRYGIPRRTHRETMLLRPDLMKIWKTNVVTEGIKNLDRVRNIPELRKKWAESFSRKPTKIEIYLDKLLQDTFPNQWKYVGNGEVIIGYWNPDFINIDGQKKLLELFGEYWHKGENPQTRIDKFAKYGFQTLIIWESELKNPELVIEKIRNFNTDS